tara:strand:+ start:1876 stop:2598 length:723 start_codon:yes stop_codon:yes gene_type:complete
MTERTLVVEFQPLSIEDDTRGAWQYSTTTNYEELSLGLFVSRSSLDLSGYQLKDETVFFRSSFEQVGSLYSIQWQLESADPILPNRLNVLEQVIVSTVPMNDSQLQAYIQGSPGFNQYSDAGLPAGEWGNFNREHIIHGHYSIHGIQTNIADPLDAAGYSIQSRVVSEYYSSLEPTTADKLYCYRLLYVFGPALDSGNATGITNFYAPPLRVIMPIVTAEEPWLEYVMRQARSYELANQV